MIYLAVYVELLVVAHAEVAGQLRESLVFLVVTIAQVVAVFVHHDVAICWCCQRVHSPTNVSQLRLAQFIVIVTLFLWLKIGVVWLWALVVATEVLVFC